MVKQHYSLQLPVHLVIEAQLHDVIEVKKVTNSSVFVRINHALRIYELADGNYQEVHYSKDFFALSTKNANYPWDVYEPSTLVVRSPKGIEVYKWNGSNLTLQYKTSTYHDLTGYGLAKNTFLFGNIFPSKQRIGIISRLGGAVQVRALILKETNSTLKVLKKSPVFKDPWTIPTNAISLVEHLDNSPQQAISLRTKSQLKLFRFDAQYKLKQLTAIKPFPRLDSEYDRIMFAKFNQTKYNDLLHFSTDGLKVYRYNETASVYQKIFYSTAFSKLRSWDSRSVQAITSVDIDGHGYDKLVFTGPKGLHVLRAHSTPAGFELSNVFFDTIANQTVLYSPLKLVTKEASSKNLELLLHTSNGLVSVRTKHEDIDEAGKSIERLKPIKPIIQEKEFRTIPEIVANRYHARWLHDQLDLSSVLQPINPYNGAVELMLPVVDIPAPFGIPIRQIIQYKNVAYNNELGRGWSFPLDYIALDRQSSAFVQDHVYSLMKENQRIILIRQPKAQRDDQTHPELMSFTIDGYPDVQIVFNTKRNFWKLTIDKRIMTYIPMNNFQTSIACPMWPLCGSQSRQTQTYTTRWFLNVEEIVDSGHTAYYFYDFIKNNTDIRLTSVSMSDDSSIELSYSEDRITKLSVLTQQFAQHFTFHYSDNMQPLLQTIKQSNYNVFDFEYDQQHRLSKIVYPNGGIWTPVYAQIAINPTVLKKSIPIDFESAVYYGPDYVVIVDGNLTDGRLVLHFRGPLGELGSNKTDGTETVYGLNDIKRYVVHAIENLIVVVIIYDSCKDIAILHFTDGRWQHQKYYDLFPLNGIVSAGNTFILLSDLKSLRLVTTTTDLQFSDVELRNNLPPNFTVKAFPHGYATYERELQISLLQANGEWLHIKAAPEKVNYFKEIDDFISSFAISHELSQSIRKGLVADMLGSFRQAIIAKVPVLRKDVLEIHVRFYMLDLTETPKMFDYYTTKIPYAVLSHFNYTVSTEEKDQFVLGYRLVDKKYHLFVKKSTGPHAVELNKYLAEAKKQMAQYHMGSHERKRIWNQAKKTTKEESARIYKSVKDAVVFAIDLSQFGLLTNQDGVLVGNHRITYDGLHWNKQHLDEDTIRLRKVNQSLNADYRFIKAHANDTFKIVSAASGATLFDTNTTKSEEIQLVVPYYAQSQPKNNSLRVYFFDNQEIVTFPAEEKLNRASNQIAIITTHYAKETEQSLLFRCAKYFLNPFVTVLGNQTITFVGETARTTEYIYDAQDLQLSVDGAMFRKIKIAPGANTTRFGWYEQSIDLETGNSVRKAYASDGQEVLDKKLREQEEKRRQSEKQNSPKRSDLERMILDVNERVPIVDLGPYRLREELVSYYGFENYEKNLFGTEKQWIFDQKLLAAEYNNRFLALKQREHKLTGEFVPREPHMAFVVSCWLRSTPTLKLGDPVDVLRVDVMVANQDKKTMSSEPAEVKQTIGAWNYVETIIDTTHFPAKTKLRFVIVVSPTATHPTIDIDHIRFSPLSIPFEAKIYEPGRGDVSAVLSGSGLMKQYFYNRYGKKTVVFSEHGTVEHFVTDSKVVYTRQLKRRPCVVEMKPRTSGWFGKNGLLGVAHSGGSISKTFHGTWNTLALRFLYSLSSNDKDLRFVWRNTEFLLPCTAGMTCPKMPLHGEILIFITPVRVSIWVDGVLTQETLLEAHATANTERTFTLHLSPTTQLWEFIEMYDPTVKVTYHSLAGQPTQVLKYETPTSILLREILYDEIERPILQTKWTRIDTETDAQMFRYFEHFVQTFDNTTLQLTGQVTNLNPGCDGFPYTLTVYGDDPTENKRMQGLPGKDYTISGKYMRAYSYVPANFLLSGLFPERRGFTHKAVHLPGGAVRVTVENGKGIKVAKYSKVGNYEHRLSTWRYGTNGKLQQELPPMYHYAAQTSATERLDPFHTTNYTAEQMLLQQQWEVRYVYDDANRLIRKRTPDGGIFQYLYDQQGILRFSLHKDQNETLDRVIHFTYLADDKVTREAIVHLNETECKELVNNGTAPTSTNFIDTLYGEYDKDPNMRYRSKFASRRIADDQMTEFMVFDQSNRLLKKVFVVNTINTSYSIDYEYENDKLRSIKYPIGAGDEPFSFIYDRNGHGDITSIRESAMEEPIFEFTYNADGMMETMKVRTDAKHMFQRNFTYNEPGFLVKLEDEYLSESVSYLETDSYGQDSYTPIYEGLISRTLFTAHWQKSAGSLRNGIYPEFFITDNMDRKRAALCNEMLRRTGYIDKNNFVTKTFYGELDDDLPFVCVKRIAMKHLSGVLSSKSFPYQYGHRYDYDDHDQLIKAKYVHGLDELALSPLTRRTFSKEIEGIDEATSKKIWDALRTKSFLTMDCTNPNLCHGREGTKSIFSDFIRLHRHSYHLKTMLSKAISKRKALNLKEFEQKCKRWIEGSSMTMKMCSNLQQTLSSENIIGDNPTNPLSSLHAEFRKALKRYERYIPDVVGVLTHHFATALGRSAADVQSYEIDANGNHRKFYTGFTRYRLEYRPGTNQISKLYRQQFDRVQRAQEQFSMAHDSDGAVIQAEHKGIKHMEYDKLLHRVSKIEMMDERKLIYQYDVRGERTFKQVLDKDGRVTSEKYYIRDANGLVLMDMDMTYLADDKPPDVRVTSYIYKDQQLIGFLRNDKLYAVITDHEGSVRLVVKDGEVIAAYDYLPYGQIFRRFGTDYDGQLSYLYTGQEWEPETGLYNYRARLYDPDIGRFYQMDPKEQYPSPYVYAGNSPVALIDPDGELAFAISCIIMAIIGAYIGAASAAKSWNPLEWNWKSKSLWLGIICGALTGLSIPYNMTASIAYFVGMGLSLSASIGVMIGSGITFGYFALAASSGSWDPRNFDFSSPGTWNALLGGIATSAFIVTSPNSLISTFRSITTTLGRALFVVSTVSITVSFAYLFGALKMGGEFDVRKWDFTDPGLYYSIIDAYVTASFVTVTARNLPGTIKKFGKKIETGLDRLAETEIYFRAKQLMRGDWSSKLANARFFLAANAQAIGNLQRGIIPIAFYTFFVSLRMADSYEKSAIPGFSVFLQIIQTAFMTKGFTNRVVKPLMPSRVNTPLAQRLEAVPSHDDHTDHASSAADCLRSIFHTLHIPFEWLFSHAEHTHYREYPSSNTIDNYSAHYRPTTKHSTIENCHAMTHGKGDVRYYVNCYSHRSFVTIHPKDDAVLEAHDNYRHCLPLTYNGVPAISCDGHRSTLLAVQLEPPKMFAYVDGWLLLARVAPAALREAKRIFQSLFARESNVAGVLKETLEKRISVRESMQKTILDLQTLCKKTVSNGWNMSWFNSMLSDLEEDVHEYCCYGRGNGSILLERLAALYSDAKEEIELRESSKILSDIPAVNANTQNVCDLGFFLGSSDTNTCYTGSTDLSLSSV